MTRPRDVTAKLTYLVPGSERPAYISGEPGEDERPTGQYVEIPVTIRDARSCPKPPELETEGFVLIRHETPDVEFGSDQEVSAKYYPQVAALLKHRLGANDVVVFDHNVRIDAEQTGIRRPARHVHVDYTFRSAIRRVAECSNEANAVERLRRRFAQINFWRPIRHMAQTSPLALADSRSVMATDYVTVDIIYPSWKGEILEVAPGASHRWFYFPDMTPDEGIVFKGFDSAPGPARRTPHTAFEAPGTPPDAPRRMSIELRALVFF